MPNAIFHVSAQEFAQIPGVPIVYWLSKPMLDTFAKNKALEEIAGPKVGLQTGDNARFVREWWEVSQSKLKLTSDNAKDRKTSACDKWFPYNKGGEYRKWYGNQDYVINWENAGQELYDFKPKSVIRKFYIYF